MQDFDLKDFLIEQEVDQQIADLCQKESIEIQISYSSDFRSAKILREIVDKICKGCWVSPKWRTRLVLIIDELNNNAIEYGSQQGEQNIFKFILQRNTKQELYIESSVSDTGNGNNAKTAQEMENIRQDHKDKDFSSHNSIRGRGLFLIISQLVDSLYFKDTDQNGLTVGIQKLLQKDC